MLRPNLEALAGRDPELAERIRWPVGSDHVALDGDTGDAHYRLHQGRYRLSLPPELVERSLAAAGMGISDGPPAQAAPGGGGGDPRGVFLFGIGLGEQLDAVLSARPGAAVVAWDRDPWLVRLALGRYDWAGDLGSGRLRLLMGSDLVDFAAAADTRARFAPPLFHPFLGNVYKNERALLEPGAAARPLVLLCAGGLFVDDLAAALRDAGYALFTTDIHRLSRDELARTVRRLRPAAIAAINYTEGLAEFAAAHGCALLCWEVDPTTSALPRCAAPTDRAFMFTYRRAAVAELRDAGFTHAEYLPLGADPRRRAPVAIDARERERYGAAISFVGSSMLPQADGFRQAFASAFAAARPAVRPNPADAGAVLDDLLADQRRDFSRYTIPDALARRCPDLAAGLPPERLAQLARLAGEIAAAEKRAAYVDRLGPLGIRTWGDEGWLATQASGAVYQGRAGHDAELTKIYGASLVNLDIGRLYQSDIVTMRVFDVLACGGFVLAEWSEELSRLFEIGVEVDCYRDADELQAKAALYVGQPDRARAIALRGRDAVRRRHTIAARVARMLAVSGLHGGQVGV